MILLKTIENAGDIQCMGLGGERNGQKSGRKSGSLLKVEKLQLLARVGRVRNCCTEKNVLLLVIVHSSKSSTIHCIAL